MWRNFVGMMPPFWYSLLIMLSLCVLFAGSWVMFWILSTRSTTQRYWITLMEWGRDKRMPLRPCRGDVPPPPLDMIAAQRTELRVCLSNRKTMLAQFQSYSPIDLTSPAAERQLREGLWNVLIRELDAPWPGTGLRPTGASSSVVDLFSLTSHPLLGASERFVVFGSDSRAAAALARSSTRGLLPPDIGLVLYGPNLVLDFSDRPFDTVEFERMIAVADQIVGHLPSEIA